MTSILDKPLTPCVGICTATVFGGICSGCGRTEKEVNEWITYTREEKLKIMKRLENERNNKTSSL